MRESIGIGYTSEGYAERDKRENRKEEKRQGTDAEDREEEIRGRGLMQKTGKRREEAGD